MVIDSFKFFILQSLFFAIMFFVSTWILIPKAAGYYSQWKSTGKSNCLSAASTCFVMAGLFLAADFAMFISAFTKSV